jgi:hypothetical protein
MDLRRGWKDLDRILRGEATRLPELKRGTVEIPLGGLAVVLTLLGMIYGVCMGSYAVFRGSPTAGLQVLASTVKVPALFALTLVVTFPSLYVFNALVGSRLSIGAVLRLLLAALGVTVAVLASLGPIVAFFSASTTSYPFMQLLNVAAFAVSGLLGMAFLLQSLHRLSLIVPEAPSGPEPPPEAGPGPEPGPEVLEPARPDRPTPGALDRLDDRVLSRHVKAVFRCWIVLFGLVGAQMGWVLRPFIGNPALRFAWFRPRESNIFQAVLQALGNLFSG